MKRCSIIGGHGYIGRHLGALMLNSGWDCRLMGRGECTRFEQDLGVVYFCAGLTADFRQRPLDTVDSHVGLLHRLLSEGRFERLIYLSSSRVYLDAPGTDEDQMLSVLSQRPDDLYKLSKLMGESLALHSRRDCTVVRVSNVVGGRLGNPDSFVYSLLKAAGSGHISLQSEPSTAKDYIHVDDVVSVLARMSEKCRFNVYNLASGRQVTHQQWLDRICQVHGCTWSAVPGAERQLYLPIQTHRIQNEFGFEPRAVLDIVDLTAQKMQEQTS